MTGEGLRVAVFGATGLAGTGVARAWQDDPRVVEVRAVTRRPLPSSLAGLTEVRCDDFLDLSPIAAALRGLDAVCFCLGLSASQAESSAHYREVTHDYAMSAARATLAASPDATFHFVSGSGAGERAWMEWARVKAETERDLAGLGLAGCIAWRPAMILADAEPDRLAWLQRGGGALARPFVAWRPVAITNTDIGRAMLRASLDGRRDGVVENAEMRDLADALHGSGS